MKMKVLLTVVGSIFPFGAGYLAAQTVDLPTSKQLIGEIPGHPQRLNSLPMTMAISPDHRFVVTVNAGYGTVESHYEQSLAVLDTVTGSVEDFPDDRTPIGASQTLFSGLAFSRDGRHLYASMGSLTVPEGDGKKATGSGVVVYSFKAGQIAAQRFIPLPLQQLAPGKKTRLIGGVEGDKGVPFPADLAVVGPADPALERLLVADNLSDDVLLIDPATGKIEKRFDLSESNAVPSTYPIALIVPHHGGRAFVALWNSSEIAELDLEKGKVGRRLALLKPQDPVAPGTHPCAFQLSPDEKTLYVALANRDAVAAVNVGPGEYNGEFSVKGYFDTRLPGQSYFGAEPEALAMNADGSRLYVANAISDAIAVIDPQELTRKAVKQGMVEPIGFIPTEWMPMALEFLPTPNGGKLYVATAKGMGTGPNGAPMNYTDSNDRRVHRPTTYIVTLLHGSLAVLNARDVESDLPQWTSVVMESNRMKAAAEKITFAGADQNRIKHVI
ncbi:MAG: hypothetical protein ACLPY1_05410 [Terracidiphilus sp.]